MASEVVWPPSADQAGSESSGPAVTRFLLPPSRSATTTKRFVRRPKGLRSNLRKTMCSPSGDHLPWPTDRCRSLWVVHPRKEQLDESAPMMQTTSTDPRTRDPTTRHLRQRRAAVFFSSVSRRIRSVASLHPSGIRPHAIVGSRFREGRRGRRDDRHGSVPGVAARSEQH